MAGKSSKKISNNKKPLSIEEVTNLKRLSLLLDPLNENQLLMLAEAKRELGEFKEASILLQEPFSENYIQSISLIQKLVKARNPFVAEIRS